MIKSIVLEERLRGKNRIKQYHDEIIFLQNEISKKNNVFARNYVKNMSANTIDNDDVIQNSINDKANSTISSESINIKDNSSLHSSEFDDDGLFKDLYHQYVMFTKREADNKINNDLHVIRRNKHNDYLLNGKKHHNKLNYSHKLNVKNHEVRESDITGEVMRKRKSILILSDSMLNQIDESRLCKYSEVKVRCHGGCTVNCMYSHLPALLCDKPDYVVLHISTNDCVSKTSDEVLLEIVNLIEYIEKSLPSCTVVVSQPTLRTEDAKADKII